VGPALFINAVDLILANGWDEKYSGSITVPMSNVVWMLLSEVMFAGIVKRYTENRGNELCRTKFRNAMTSRREKTDPPARLTNVAEAKEGSEDLRP
jgi:hypothetical protein